MMATAGPPMFVWYLMRGSGLVALLLLSATVALGVVGIKRWSSWRWPRLVTAGLHRNLALLAVSFLAVHVGTAVVDEWVGVRWFGILVPFTSHYRPVWVGLGAVALDLLIAVVVTSLLRRRVGIRTWRLVHWCTWLLWPVALAHALGSGTDAFSGLGLAVCGISVAGVTGAAVWRLCPVARGRTMAGSGTRPPAGPTAVGPAVGRSGQA